MPLLCQCMHVKCCRWNVETRVSHGSSLSVTNVRIEVCVRARVCVGPPSTTNSTPLNPPNQTNDSNQMTNPYITVFSHRLSAHAEIRILHENQISFRGFFIHGYFFQTTMHKYHVRITVTFWRYSRSSIIWTNWDELTITQIMDTWTYIQRFDIMNAGRIIRNICNTYYIWVYIWKKHYRYTFKRCHAYFKASL